MIRSALIAAASVLMLLPLAASPDPFQDADVKRTLSDAEGIRKSVRKLSKESREKIEKALGAKLPEDKDLPAIYEARASVASVSGQDKTRVLWTSVPLRGAKGDIRIGVAVVPEDSVVAAVKILENKDDKTVESPSFLGQFEGFEYTDSLSKPVSELEKARSQAKEGKDNKAKELAVLITVLEKMHSIDREWDSMSAKIDKEEAGAGEAADRMKLLIKDTVAILPPLKTFLQQGQIDRFSSAMKDSVSDLDKIAGSVKAKKFVDANKAAHQLGTERCAKCHAWAPQRFRERRKALGIGNGYFVLGHELAAPAEGIAESFQAVATAVRRAVLILSEAK